MKIQFEGRCTACGRAIKVKLKDDAKTGVFLTPAIISSQYALPPCAECGNGGYIIDAWKEI